MRTLVRVIDSLSEWAGKTICWFCVALVMLMTFEVIMRYVFNAPTLWVYETSIMIGTTIYIVAWSYAHRHHSHVRVDVFYIRLSLRGKAIIDVVGDLLLFSPLIIILVYASVDWTWASWLEGEVMPQTGWYPPHAPLRTVVTMALCLFALQGGAQFIRDLYVLIRNKPYD